MILILFSLGFIFGSFIGATTWRLKKYEKNPSLIYKGRSICENCKHELSALDLVPLFSFLFLRGKCRYCHHKIGWFAPFIEIFTAFIFVLNYILWTYGFNGIILIYFIIWLLIIVNFMILSIYDFRWKTLPSSIIYITWSYSIIGILVYLISTHNYAIMLSRFWGILIGGGIFWIIYQISNGEWIGGGDVRLGFLLGFIVGGPINSIFMLMIASFSALIFAIPQMFISKIKIKSQIPFGPFLIFGCVMIFLIGSSITTYLKNKYLIP